MQVIAARHAGAAAAAQITVQVDRVAHFHGDGRQVRLERLQSHTVVENDAIAIESQPARVQHRREGDEGKPERLRVRPEPGRAAAASIPSSLRIHRDSVVPCSPVGLQDFNRPSPPAFLRRQPEPRPGVVHALPVADASQRA